MNDCNMILLGMFGGPEILIIVFVLLLLFGANKIPELMKGLGKGIKEFKDATHADEIAKDINETSGQVNSTLNETNKSAKSKPKDKSS